MKKDLNYFFLPSSFTRVLENWKCGGAVGGGGSKRAISVLFSLLSLRYG